MKRKPFIGLTFALTAALFLTGCDKVPQVEIDAANAAIDEVKMAEAEVYAYDSFVMLNDSMSKAMILIENEKSEFFKNFDQAKEHLLGVVQFAQEVKQKTGENKERLKMEIQTAIGETTSLIESCNQLMTEAPKGKEGTMALTAIKNEIMAVDVSVNEANALLMGGQLLPAKEKISAAMEKANSIKAELTDVITKYQSKSKRK